MKTPIKLYMVFLTLGVLLVSCDQFYFSTPQPVDSNNIYEFPNEYRGSWRDNGDSIIIDKKHFISIEYNERKVPQTEVETSSKYLLKNDKIYLVDTSYKDKSEGFSYTLNRDTLFFVEKDVFELTLDGATFLRKWEGGHLLNSKPENSNWWEIFLVEISDQGDIITRYLQEEDIEKISELKTLHYDGNQYYLEAQWTAKQIGELVDKGVFSDTLLVLRKVNQ